MKTSCGARRRACQRTPETQTPPHLLQPADVGQQRGICEAVVEADGAQAAAGRQRGQNLGRTTDTLHLQKTYVRKAEAEQRPRSQGLRVLACDILRRRETVFWVWSAYGVPPRGADGALRCVPARIP